MCVLVCLCVTSSTACPPPGRVAAELLASPVGHSLRGQLAQSQTGDDGVEEKRNDQEAKGT